MVALADNPILRRNRDVPWTDAGGIGLQPFRAMVGACGRKSGKRRGCWLNFQMSSENQGATSNTCRGRHRNDKDFCQILVTCYWTALLTLIGLLSCGSSNPANQFFWLPMVFL